MKITMTFQEQRYGVRYLLFQLGFLGLFLSYLPLGPLERNLCFFLIDFLAVCWIFRGFLKRSLQALRPLPVLGCAALGLAAYFALGFLLAWLMPEHFNANDASVAAMARQQYVLMFAATVFLVPVTEELFYRGLLFSLLYERSRLLALAVSTLLFSAVHIIGYMGLIPPLSLLLSFLQYIPAGLCLGWAYAKSQSIFAPILIHSFINAIGMLSVR